MSGVTDFVALTLLPLRRWRRVAEQLQGGQAAPAILEQHCSEWTADPRTRSRCPGAAVLRARADAALERASLGSIECLPWTDPRYPQLLRHIFDPPPVIWING